MMITEAEHCFNICFAYLIILAEQYSHCDRSRTQSEAELETEMGVTGDTFQTLASFH